MAYVLSGGSDYEKLQDLCSKTYKEQAVWFLNSFWEAYASNEAETVWAHTLKFNQLDENKKADGNALDEFFAHRFLELVHETLTVHAMRDKLRAVGAIGQTERPKVVPLIHYLIWKYNANWKEMVNAPQGSREEIEKAERLLREVQAAFRECELRDREASEALREATATEAEAKRSEADAKAKESAAIQRDAEAKKTEAAAKQRESEAVQRQEELRVAKSEVEAALAEVKAQEDAYNGRTAELKRLSEEGGLVSRNKAKNELAQHLGEDPLPLRRAKITLEAAVKKADRASVTAASAAAEASEARAAAEESAQQASHARGQAEASARAAERARGDAEKALKRSEQAKQAAEAALDEARERLSEAEVYVEEVKKRLPLGASWWLERELHEARAYLPTAKGGYAKKRVV